MSLLSFNELISRSGALRFIQIVIACCGLISISNTSCLTPEKHGFYLFTFIFSLMFAVFILVFMVLNLHAIFLESFNIYIPILIVDILWILFYFISFILILASQWCEFGNASKIASGIFAVLGVIGNSISCYYGYEGYSNYKSQSRTQSDNA